MLSVLFGRSRRNPQQAAEELMSLLEEKASLVVDEDLVAAMGVGRNALYRIIYEMLRRERMSMLADRNGQMLLMTNSEFNRFLFRSSGRTAPLPALTLEPMRVETVAMEMQPEVIFCAEGDDALVLEDAPEPIIVLDWFDFDETLKETAATEVPEHRQSLPERRREPWSVAEESEPA